MWTSPLRQVYHSRGEPIIVALPEPEPAGPQPGEDSPPSLRRDGPIIHIPEPEPPSSAEPMAGAKAPPGDVWQFGRLGEPTVDPDDPPPF